MIKIESNAEYHASAPLSKSRLFEMRKSPQWFRYCEDHPQGQTPSMLLGSVFHTLVLEPHKFCEEYLLFPDVDRRTREGKDIWAAAMEEAQTKTIVPQEVYDTAAAMAEAVRTNKLAAYLSKGEVERSYYTVDKMTGIEYKVRPDCFKIINGRGLIVDFKSTADASTDAFRRDAIKYGYDLQSAMYTAAVQEEHGIPCDFVFVAVEKEPPYMVNIMQCDPLWITRGTDLFREYIGRYKECTETGNWYGLNGALDIINNLALPSYLAKEIE